MRAALLAVGLAAVLAAGCSDAPPAEAESLTREEYAERADAICVQYERRLRELGEPESLDELARLAGEAEPIAREGLAELRALEPPEEIRPEVEEWLDLSERNVEATAELAEAAEEGDATRVQELASEASDNEEEADRLARRIGLEDCAASDR